MQRLRTLTRVAQHLALALTIAGSAAPVLAQPRRPPDDGDGGEPARRQEIKKKIRAMRAFTLTEELSLDETTAGRLFPVLGRFDDETDKILQKRQDLQKRLRHVDTMRDPAAIEKLIDDAIQNQRALWNLDERKLNELRKVLTPPQMAKLLVVLPQLERKIQNQLRKAIQQLRPIRPKAGGKPGAFDDDDDDLEPDELPARPAPKPPRRENALPPAAPGGASNAPGNTPPYQAR